MKKFILVLIFVFVLIGYNEVTRFNRETTQSIKATQETTQACTIDMQNNKDLICD